MQLPPMCFGALEPRRVCRSGAWAPAFFARGGRSLDDDQIEISLKVTSPCRSWFYDVAALILENWLEEEGLGGTAFGVPFPSHPFLEFFLLFSFVLKKLHRRLEIRPGIRFFCSNSSRDR